MNLEDFRLKFINFKNQFQFPDGTLSFQAEFGGSVIAVQDFDLQEILLKQSACIESGMERNILYAPYIPARQDRICNNGEPFSVKAFANFINWLNFSKVITLEPHSDVLPALINKCETLTYKDVFDFKKIECLNSDSILNVVAPDAGAIKRTEKFVKSVLDYNPDKRINLVQGVKNRNVKNGDILSIKVDKTHIEGECIVVDDVCAKGTTFLGIYEALKEAGATNINLILAHADKKNGLDNLAEKYKKIYVTNSQSFEVKKENIHVTKVI
jgi:ribose-phosphate pyrophosphokinase